MFNYGPLWQTMEAKGVSQYQLLKGGIDNRTLDSLKKRSQYYNDHVESSMQDSELHAK